MKNILLNDTRNDIGSTCESPLNCAVIIRSLKECNLGEYMKGFRVQLKIPVNNTIYLIISYVGKYLYDI